MTYEEIRDKLSKSKVVIAGLGGLGSNIAMMLARSGIGHLRLIDFDVVDESNLNRQLYTVDDIGRPKTEALEEILTKINPNPYYEMINTKITRDNVSKLVEGFPIACEAMDKAEIKSMFVQEVLSNYSDTIVVSGNGMAGYKDANSIRTKQKMSRLYVCGDNTTGLEETKIIMAPKVMICAGHQANKIIELLVEKED